MTWHSNEAATREIRRMLGNYVKAQDAGRYGRMLEFTGMTGEEWARWVDIGEVSGRLMRVWFHGYDLNIGDGYVTLRSEDKAQVQVPYGEAWRVPLIQQARKCWPGGADRIQAYIETQVRR